MKSSCGRFLNHSVVLVIIDRHFFSDKDVVVDVVVVLVVAVAETVEKRYFSRCRG